LKGIDANIRHEAVPVPAGLCPFDQEGLSLFQRGLNMLTDSGDLPHGYGATLDELSEDGFDEQEEINIGLQKKGFPINLPNRIWKPRMEIWAQGLFVMNSILAVSH
jgi:hypothetical protein